MATLRKPGRSAFKPTPALRRQVTTLAAFGLPPDEICRIIFNPNSSQPISRKTLQKYFRQELEAGAVKATSKVADTLYRQAVGAPAAYDKKGRLLRAERPPVLSAAIFWMKTRARLEELALAQRDAAEPSIVIKPAGDELDKDV